ncbi:uncharacterized protein LOC141758272 isoform X1 [Sebastes fasciatus]|uniref:uncharacterized protein LOC141758272 isoform X1 n=1 Tax=Sebastes fasciatus TaxID=394691 RepID=UPI003D9F17CB
MDLEVCSFILKRQDSLVKGGVLIVHQIHEGKHQYEVGNVMKYKKASQKVFVRRGDKLIQINGVDLEDLTPEELAQSLAKDNLILKVHNKASKMGAYAEQSFPAEDTLQPFDKESTTLCFSMEMRRAEDLENEVEQVGGGKEEVCPAEDKENGVRDLLVVSMKKTSFSVVRGRGCDSRSHCHGCPGTGCTFNDVVMVAESSEVVLVPRGSGSFTQITSRNTPIEHVATSLYIRGLCQQRIPYSSPNPEEMTIYYYKTSGSFPFKGQAVVLNFSKTNCFLQCCKEGERVFLQVETCDKKSLKKISKTDESTLSYVFYMKTQGSTPRTFESALHGGWFIQIDDTAIHRVGVANLDGTMGDEPFFFIIQV